MRSSGLVVSDGVRPGTVGGITRIYRLGKRSTMSEGKRVCPRCRARYVAFGQECCEQIDWWVQLTRVVHRRPTY